MRLQTNIDGRRLILRVEATHGGQGYVGHTVEVSEAGAFLQISLPAEPGDELTVRLSFPRILDPLELTAEVTARRVAEEPGDLSGIEVRFRFAGEDERARLTALLSRGDLTASGSSPAIPTGRPRSYHVLLVEDNDMIRDMFAYGVRKYFKHRQAPVQVDYAIDGQIAWQMMGLEIYDLVIVDYYLPVVDGSNLVRRIREDQRLTDTPVVAISVGGDEARSAFLDAGADIFLDKPIVIFDLFRTLERLTP
jgi:CheY-like chemotaxis protein